MIHRPRGQSVVSPILVFSWAPDSFPLPIRCNFGRASGASVVFSSYKTVNFRGRMLFPVTFAGVGNSLRVVQVVLEGEAGCLILYGTVYFATVPIVGRVNTILVHSLDIFLLHVTGAGRFFISIAIGVGRRHHRRATCGATTSDTLTMLTLRLFSSQGVHFHAICHVLVRLVLARVHAKYHSVPYSQRVRHHECHTGQRVDHTVVRR